MQTWKGVQGKMSREDLNCHRMRGLRAAKSEISTFQLPQTLTEHPGSVADRHSMRTNSLLQTDRHSLSTQGLLQTFEHSLRTNSLL